MPISTRLNARIVLPLLALSVAVPAIAWTRSAESLSMQAESRIWVDGKSSIKDFSCKAPEVSAVIDAAPNAVASVAAGEKAVRTVRITVPADKMDCGNGTMNQHMKKALKVDENPTIVFRLASYEVSKTANGANGTLRGTLALGGVEKPVTIAAEGSTVAGALHVTGSYEVKMSDYDLTPPSLMFGRIKVRDAVDVKFDLMLKN
jgi:polyisoprenoid-binding protein YceI